MIISPLLAFPLFASLVSCYQEYIAVGGGKHDLYIRCDDNTCFGTKDRNQATRFEVNPSEDEFRHFKIPGTDRCLHLGQGDKQPLIIAKCSDAYKFTINGLSDNRSSKKMVLPTGNAMAGVGGAAYSEVTIKTYRRPFWHDEGMQLDSIPSAECTAFQWQCFHWHAEKV